MKLRNQYKNPSGVKDYFNNEGLIREELINLIKGKYVTSGFLPMDTSILNNTDLLSSKYAGGSEILKEMYNLTDGGERDLSLRYDLTVPFLKYMSMNPTLKFPVKRYEIGKVFRDGPVKKGRLREFTQCDIDILGVSDVLAEAELISVVSSVLREVDINFRTEINNVKIINGLLEYLDVDVSKYKSIFLTLDKKLKITEAEMISNLLDLGMSESQVYILLRNLDQAGYEGIESLLGLKVNLITEGVKEVLTLLNYLDSDEVIYNPYLARGLEIYTGCVYEVFIVGGVVSSSIASGGRYNNILGKMMGGKIEIDAVGMSLGLDVLMEELSSRELKPNNVVDYLIIPLGTEKECLKLAGILRDKGYVVEIEMIKKSLSKALKYADANGYSKVLILGEDEVKEDKVLLKDLDIRESYDISMDLIKTTW